MQVYLSDVISHRKNLYRCIIKTKGIDIAVYVYTYRKNEKENLFRNNINIHIRELCIRVRFIELQINLQMTSYVYKYNENILFFLKNSFFMVLFVQRILVFYLHNTQLFTIFPPFVLYIFKRFFFFIIFVGLRQRTQSCIIFLIQHMSEFELIEQNNNYYTIRTLYNNICTRKREK